MNRDSLPPLRTLMILARIPDLPTVWSNCLAGWWLSGGGNPWKLAFLLPGMSALHLGGMFLNDAFDAEFDRQRKAARPIPAGKISPATVWRFGWSWLVLGILCLLCLGKLAGMLAIALGACILVFNTTHKFFTASPWLIGLCRFWVYTIAGTTGAQGLNGWPIWCGAALAFYVAGMNYVAQRENSRAPLAHWPLVLLAAPIMLAQLMNVGDAFPPALAASLILALWLAFCLRALLFQPGELNVTSVISRLLAGIVLVDWLAVSPQCPRELCVVFLILFSLTLLLQRLIPLV